MKDLGDVDRHFWMTRSVARVMGVSLTEAMMNDRLTAEDYAELVTQCRTCPHISHCEQWLATQTEITRSAPTNCLNRRTLEMLSRQN